jgi:hypothetical protein
MFTEHTASVCPHLCPIPQHKHRCARSRTRYLCFVIQAVMRCPRIQHPGQHTLCATSPHGFYLTVKAIKEIQCSPDTPALSPQCTVRLQVVIADCDCCAGLVPYCLLKCAFHLPKSSTFQVDTVTTFTLENSWAALAFTSSIGGMDLLCLWSALLTP